MCSYDVRVHSCGHYTKEYKPGSPCDTAKQNKRACSGSENQVSTGGLCYLPECDKKASLKREGPGGS